MVGLKRALVGLNYGARRCSPFTCHLCDAEAKHSGQTHPLPSFFHAPFHSN